MDHLVIINIATVIHLLADLYLLCNIWNNNSTAGISGKSQILYALVYSTRYLDLFTTFISYLNNFFKLTYLMLSYVTLMTLLFFRKTREKQYDSFSALLIVTCCTAAAILINHEFTLFEVLWTFSVYLEALAMLPQFHYISKARYAHKHVYRYLIALAVYKFLHLPHWVYRYYREGHYDEIVICGAVIQCLLYLDFFSRIAPRLQSRLPAVPEISTIGDKLENPHERLTGCSLMGRVVLLPSTVVDVTNDKVNLLNDETK